jgi:hypothetical protein
MVTGDAVVEINETQVNPVHSRHVPRFRLSIQIRFHRGR